MSVWVLILTAAIQAGYGSNSAIDHIEFRDESSCKSAAKLWVKNQDKAWEYRSLSHAICVPR